MTRRQQKKRSAARTQRYPLIAAAISVALGCPVATLAADSATDDAEAPGGQLQEIVVTANRRSESVLNVPYNISAVSGNSLQNAGVTDLSSLSRMLPGVTIPDMGARGNGGNSMIIIRGLNVNNPVNSQFLPWGSVPTVSTYVDDVPQYVNLKLDDIQRVEVLRGPQGTLYGSGAVGGTIKIIHNQPSLAGFSASVSAETSYTDHTESPSYATTGTLNVPLGSNAAFRVSAGYSEDAGFINAINAVEYGPNMQPVLANPADPLNSGLVYHTVKHIDDSNDWHLRAALLWKALNWLDVNLAYQRQSDHADGFSNETQGLAYETELLVPHQPEQRTVELDSLTLAADVGFATVTSSTSYSVARVNNVIDGSQYILAYAQESPLLYGGYPRVTSTFNAIYHDESFTQELRITSKGGAAWDYAAGLFFQHQTEHLDQTEYLPGFAAWTELPGSAAVVPATTPGAPYANFGDYLQYYNGGVRPSADVPLDSMYTYDRRSGFRDEAIYGELTRHVTDKWQITGGARVFRQEFAQGLHSTIPDGGPFYSTLPYPENLTDQFGTTDVERHLSFNSHIFKANTSYAITQDVRAYATFSQGFRHGGINALPIGNCIFCESETIVPYKSDRVNNYELGVKGSNSWLRFSGAVFQEDWSNIQLQAFGQGGGAAVVNGKTAVSRGVELEVSAALGSHWSSTFGYGFTAAALNADFGVSEVVNGNTFQVVSGRNGDRLPYVPRQTITEDLGFQTSLTSAIALDAHVNAAYRSNVSTQLNSGILGYQVLGGFTTVNASASLLFGSAWRAKLYVNNLTNVQGGSAAGPVAGPLLSIYDDPRYRVLSVMRPRTVGIGVSYSIE